MDTGYVKSRISEGIAKIEFYHPKGNSLPGNLLDNLAETIHFVSKKVEVKVIVLQSGGERAFCAGASFDELSQLKELSTAKTFFMGFAKVMNAMRSSPQFIIGRIQGKAVGGGVGLICTADICYATDTAAVRLSELSLGIGPFVIEPAVKRKMGIATYTSLLLNPESWVDAFTAKEKGMYDQVFNSIEEMDVIVQKKAQQLTTYSKEAMQQLKKSLWKGTGHWEDEWEQRAALSGSLVLHPEAQQMIQAILNKKK